MDINWNLTESDFRIWLKTIKDTAFMKDADPYEIADLAHYVGFSHAITLPILSHFEDALRGSNFDNKAKMHIDHETIGIELMANPFDLDDQWESVTRKQNENIDFDERGDW